MVISLVVAFVLALFALSGMSTLVSILYLRRKKENEIATLLLLAFVLSGMGLAVLIA